MKQICLLIVVWGSFLLVAKEVELTEDYMKETFERYYANLIEAEEHYYQTSEQLKLEFAKEQSEKRKKLLVSIREKYSKLDFVHIDENKALLREIKSLREAFNKEQKESRTLFKKNIFTKKQNYEDARLKRQSSFEILMRKWRSRKRGKSPSSL